MRNLHNHSPPFVLLKNRYFIFSLLSFITMFFKRINNNFPNSPRWCAGLSLMLPVFLFALLLVGCKKAATESLTATTATATDNAALQKTITAYFDAEYAYATLSGSAKSATMKSLYIGDNPELSKKLTQIDAFRAGIDKMGVHYTQSEVTVTLGAVTQNQNRLVVKTVVYARLVTDQADPDENGHFITTEGYYPYTVTVAANGTVYKIVSVSLDTLDENPWFINPQTLAPSVDFTAESKAAPSPMQVAYTYNRINAANYAYRYWSSPNSAYCDFSSGGGDCTNFVSQCLSAGGWNGNTRWYWNGYCNYLNGV
ncbi:MAG: hypothetical protein RI894_999, partial [Bacteroidota bacterium]